MRRFLRPQYFLWMRIEGDYDRRAICHPSVFRRRGDHRKMAEMDSIEDADGEKKRAG